MTASSLSVVTPAEMRRCDAAAERSFGISGLQLMEQAGRAVTESIRWEVGAVVGKHVAICCGKGNNGGDGLVVARLCSGLGAVVTVVLAESATKLKNDAKTNFAILKKMQREKANSLRIVRYTSSAMRNVKNPDILVDALFGTGFVGIPQGSYKSAIRWMNKAGAPIVSVDIPSGINGTNGVAEGECVHATRTVTLGLMKTGLLLNHGMEHSGKVEVADIGLPRSVVDGIRPQKVRATREAVASVLPVRSRQAHKYSVGKVFVLAGSRSFTGAAALCAQAVLRSGAGAALLTTPTSAHKILSLKLAEVIVQPLSETEEGSVSLEAIGTIKSKLDWCDVAIIGPGLTQHTQTGDVVEALLKSTSKPLLLDADALNVVAGRGAAILKKSKSQIIITPHTGEFSRLTGVPTAEIERNRVEVARDFASKYNVVVVLKGAPTVSAHPDGRIVFNSTGNAGMATIGSGDVLAGAMGGLWAQSHDGFNAAFAAVFLHGLAGDLAKGQFGESGLVASDILDRLAPAIRQVREVH